MISPHPPITPIEPGVSGPVLPRQARCRLGQGLKAGAARAPERVSNPAVQPAGRDEARQPGAALGTRAGPPYPGAHRAGSKTALPYHERRHRAGPGLPG